MFKFALRDFNGNPVSFWCGETFDFPAGDVPKAAAPTHRILVLDCSGSMYYSLADVKATVKKILTIDEFQAPEMRTTVITYAGKGDCVVHIKGAKADAILAPNSAHVREIDNLRTRGATCISQGLALAETFINEGETTAISLHSDGYANDYSPSSEAREIDNLIKKISAHPKAFVNTVAYSQYSDFQLLSKIANALSGSCVFAKGIREVYQALYDTTALLGKALAPGVEVSKGSFDVVLFASKDGQKILGSKETLQVRGLPATADKSAWGLRKLTEQEYNTAAAPEDNGTVLYAFARYLLSVGDLVNSKYALVSTRNTALLQAHSRALVSADLAAYAAALESAVFTPDPQVKVAATYGLPQGFSIVQLAEVFAGAPSGVLVHMPTLLNGYVRRGVKRVPGSRDASGVLTPPKTKLVAEKREWVAPSAFEVSNSEATINMRFAVPAKLAAFDTGEVISEVKGVTLDKLVSYRNYTIVGDGVVTVPTLRVRIVNKTLHTQLQKLGLMDSKFDPEAEYDLPLSEMPVLGYSQKFSALPTNLFQTFAQFKVVEKFLSGLVKEAKATGAGTDYSADQIAALKDVGVTAAGYFSAPTTTPYADLQKAIEAGEIDSRVAFMLKVGGTKVVHADDLYSANEYLKRRFTVTVDGVDVKDAKCSHFYGKDAKWSVKKLTAATKLNAVDDITYPIMATMLGLEKSVDLTTFGITDLAKIKDPEQVGDVLAEVEAAVESLLSTHIRPLAFFVGSTGLVPEALGTTMMSPDDFATKYGMKLGKDEAEGTFFVAGENTFIVYPKNKHFSTKVEVVTEDDAE